MSETETISLNVDGSFVQTAEQVAAASEALAASLGKLDEASHRVRSPQFAEASKISEQVAMVNQLAAARAKIGAFDPTDTREIAKQEALYSKMRDDALGITAARNKEANKALDGQAVELAAGALEKAGAMVLAAGAAITAGALALEKAGVATTDKHNTEGAVGGHLGADYERSVFLSLKAGVDVDATWMETKKLLIAKFSEAEIPALIRIKTGMDMAGENGAGFLAEMSKLKLEPKVQTRDVERLWKMGLDSKDVYAELAHTMGTDVAGATAKVKSGMADSAAVIAAIETVAGRGKFGVIADEQAKSVTAAFGHLKGDVEKLFDFGPDALGGINDALAGASGVIESGQGVALRASMGDLFGELNKDLLGGFQGEAGKERIRSFAASVTGSLTTITDAVHSVSGAADDLSGFFKKIDWTGAPSWMRPDSSKANEAPKSDAPSASAQVFTSTNGGEAVGAGTDLSRGVAKGIKDGEIDIAAAARGAVRSGVNAAKDEARIKSPSEEMAEQVGEPMAEGQARGMLRNTSPAAAGRQMAANAVQAAQGGAGAASAGGASAGPAGSGPVSVEVNVAITVEGGGASVEQDWQRLLPAVQRVIRYEVRDAFESARRL